MVLPVSVLTKICGPDGDYDDDEDEEEEEEEDNDDNDNDNDQDNHQKLLGAAAGPEEFLPGPGSWPWHCRWCQMP